MSVLNAPDTRTAPKVELELRPNRLFTLVAIFAMVVGIGSILGRIVGTTLALLGYIVLRLRRDAIAF